MSECMCYLLVRKTGNGALRIVLVYLTSNGALPSDVKTFSVCFSRFVVFVLIKLRNSYFACTQHQKISARTNTHTTRKHTRVREHTGNQTYIVHDVTYTQYSVHYVLCMFVHKPSYMCIPPPTHAHTQCNQDKHKPFPSNIQSHTPPSLGGI